MTTDSTRQTQSASTPSTTATGHQDATIPTTESRHPAAATPGPTELSNLTLTLRSHLRAYPDFPSPGILFEDILPLFASPSLHSSLLRALELHVRTQYDPLPEIILGLDARGFLFGPSLANRIGAGFVPVRKRGKLPGKTAEAGFEKEYGTDWFQVQVDSGVQGKRCLIVDDIIATGGSAKAAGDLVKMIGGDLIGYLFILELDFLKGRDKLDAPVFTLLSSQDAESREAVMG